MITMDDKNDIPLEKVWKKLYKTSLLDKSEVGEGVVGQCLLCGKYKATRKTNNIVSSQFTEWDRQNFNLSGIKQNGWCEMCAWAYKEPLNRKRNLLVVNHHMVGSKRIAVKEIQNSLTKKLSLEESLVLCGRGRKHVLPYAQWGKVSYEGGVYSWTDSDALLYSEMKILLNFGITTRQMRKACPPESFFTDNRKKRNYDKKVLFVAEKWEKIYRVKDTTTFLISEQVLNIRGITYIL